MNCWWMGSEVRTEGVVTGHSVRYHRDLGRLRADRESRRYRYKGSNQQVHLCYAPVLGSLSGLSMMSGGGLFFAQKRHFLRPEYGAE